MANNKDFLLKNAVEVGGPTKVTLGTVTSNDIDLATGNYFTDTLAANTTYTLSNAGDVQSFQLEVTGGVATYNIANANYDSVSFSVSGQDTGARDIVFNSNGSKVYYLGATNGAIYQYSLSTAFDLSTASYDSVSFSVSSQDTLPTGLAFSNDGTKMFMVGRSTDTIYQYSLSTGFDLSTASYDSVSASIATEDYSPEDITFNNDGTKLYMLGTGNSEAVNQYSLSTAFDLSTLSFDSVSLSVGGFKKGVTFNADGSKLFITGSSTDAVEQYNLSTPFVVSSGVSSGISFSFASQDGNANATVFNNDGTKMYMLGDDNNTIYQYSTSSGATLTWPSSIEWAGGVAPSAPATGETDVFTLSTDDGGTSYVGVKTADNLS